jgi:hypothetical protein
VILHLEMLRLSGLRWVKRRDGWVSLNQETLEAIELVDKDIRYRAVKRLRAWGWLEVRGAITSGRKLEYRLNSNWTKPEAEVVDFAAVKRAKTKRRLRP